MSHSLEALAKRLTQLLDDRSFLFSPPLIVVPHPAMKEWLQLQLCKNGPKRAIVGLEIVSWRQALQILGNRLRIPSRMELSAALSVADRSWSAAYVGQLTDVFVQVVEGFSLAQTEEATSIKKTFDDLLRAHQWRTYPEALAQISPPNRQVILFGIDFLPPPIHQFFYQLLNLQELRFSPCAMFWEDFCSVSERKRLVRMWDKKGASSQKLQSLEELLRDCPQLLANWGMLGRKMLLEGDAETDYDLEDADTLLHALKHDLLFFEKLPVGSADSSIRCVKTGASRFQEVQWLHGEIHRLLTEGVDCSEIRVYAPDISIYAPIIEFIFDQIPFRISNIDIARQSGFYQAILLLFRSVKGRWEVNDLLELFQRPAFYRKRKWGAEDIERLQEWIEMGGVRWGISRTHKQETTDSGSLLNEQGSWDHGWNQMLDSLVYFRPEQEIVVGWGEVDLFEQFYETFALLQKTLLSWREDKTLANWSKELNSLISWALDFDVAEPADIAAKNAWDKFMEGLCRAAEEFAEEKFPFSWVETHFSSSSEEEGRSLVNAIRFASLTPGAMVPAKMLFMIGMDEESFPRPSTSSSLQSLLKEAPRPPDFDRYLFLQAIFCAKEKLIFSYGDCSKEDGKPMSPSLLMQELFSYLESSFALPPAIVKGSVVKPLYMSKGSLLSNTSHIPEIGDLPTSLALQELNKFFRHPPQYYAKQVLGIEWRREPESLWHDFELSSLDRSQMLKSSLKQKVLVAPHLPVGMFGDLARKNLSEEIAQYQEHLQHWGISSESISSVQLEGFLQGEAPYAVPEGVLHFGADDIGGLFRKWPELLAVLERTGTNKIYCLRTGKIREIENPAQALQLAIQLFLRCRKSLCFLHAEWADPILRKKNSPDVEEVKDPFLGWMLETSPAFDLEQERSVWQDLLTDTFSSLIQLFPVRGQHAEV